MFQSTLPMKGATSLLTTLNNLERVSIHAPNEGSDALISAVSLLRQCFNPRSQ